MRGWKDISTPMLPELQECPECGAVAFNWWGASYHQTWHLQLAQLLEAALDGKADAVDLLSRHRSAVVTGAESGAVDTMLGERHSPPETREE